LKPNGLLIITILSRAKNNWQNKSEDISEGFYVVFSHKHTDKDELFSEELIQGKLIYTHIILTQFEQPPSSARRIEANRSGKDCQPDVLNGEVFNRTNQSSNRCES